MKTLALFFFSFFFMSASSQTWQWAKKADATATDSKPTRIRTDRLGNTFMWGTGGSTYGGLALSGSFIVKFNSAGNVVWGMNMPFAPNTLTNFKVDSDGNSYFLGQFESPVTVFGYSFTNTGASDWYIVKLDPAGIPVWGRTFGGSAGDLAIDGSQNVYIGGGFAYSVSFDAYTLTDASHSFYLAKFNALGNAIWATKGDSTFSSVQLIELDSHANPYVILSNKSMGGPSSTLIAKFDSAGSLHSYASHWGLYNQVFSFAVGDSGNVYVLHNGGGHYYDKPNLEKYDSALNYVWDKDLNAGPGSCYKFGWGYQQGVFLDEFENAYVSGRVGGFYPHCDSVYFDGALVYVGGNSVPALAALNSSGTMIWTKTSTSTDDDEVYTMSRDRDGNLMVAGVFNEHGAGDNMMFDSHPLTSSGSSKQIFVAKLNVMGFTTAVADLTLMNSVEIYPNPSSGIFTLRVNSSEAKVCVKDLMGRCVLQKNFKGDIQEVNLSGQSKGVYFLEVIADGKSVVKKIILQ